MEDNIFDIRFDYNGMHYSGWANPSKKKHNGQASSYHVVLNDTSFGHVSFSGGKWTNTEDRPVELTTLVGNKIEQYLKDSGAVGV